MKRNLNNMFWTIPNQLNDAVYIIEPSNSAFLEVNDQACEILGYTREELLNMNVFNIDPVINTMDKWKDILEIIDQEKQIRHATAHRKKDGTTFPVEVNTKIVVEGNNKYFCSVVRNLSDKKAHEQEKRDQPAQQKTR